MTHELRLMSCRLLTVLICVPVVLNQCQAGFDSPKIEWTVPLETSLDASPILYPHENPDSIVVATGGRVARIGGDGTIRFDKTFGPAGSQGGIFDPSAVDLDGDGTEELIVGHNGGFVFAVDGQDGSVLWEHSLGNDIGNWRSAIPADLDNDGRPEVLVTARDGWVRCLNGDGTLRWRSKVEEYRLGTPSVGDIDNDGQTEIVYGTATRHLIALKADGRLLWDTLAGPLHLGRTKPVIADLDRDGTAEIYAASSNIGPDTGLISLEGASGRIRWYGKTRHKAYMARGVVPFADGSLGVLIGDKANSLVAYSGDGRRRWSSQVKGNGVWTTPSIADVDGDGRQEIIVSVRGMSADGQAWYVLDLDGNLQGSFALPGGGGFGATLVADIDRDGELEVVLASRSGDVTAFSFEGPTTPTAVFSTGWHVPAFGPTENRATEVSTNENSIAVSSETRLEIALIHAPRYGNNHAQVSFSAAAIRGTDRVAVELETAGPAGIREVQLFRVASDGSSVPARWQVNATGNYQLNARLLDLDTGAQLGTGELSVSVNDVAAEIHAAKRARIESLRQTAKRVRDAAPDSTIAIEGGIGQLAARYRLLADRIQNAADLKAAASDQLGSDIDKFLTALDQAGRWAMLTESELAAGRAPRFVIWEDKNPWNNDDPVDTLPRNGGPPSISMWAFGNEIESVAINVANLTSRRLRVRWEPGTLVGNDVSMPAHESTSLRHVLRVPSRTGEIVPDLLPPLGDDYMLQIAPGEVEQVWINVSTQDLSPGEYILRWPVRTFDSDAAETELTVHLRVSSVRLPEKSRFAMGFWSKRKIGELSTIDNLNTHRQTVWYQLSLPASKADAQGELVGDLDWTEHDEVIQQAEQIDRLFYGGIPLPSLPDGIEVTPDLRRAARRNFLYALVAHLETYGLSWSDFMVYPADEPGLFGTIDHYMQSARENKELDPRLQNYANPWGSITIEDIREMAPVTDVWQPGMETVYVLGEEYIEAMRAGGKPVWMYTPPANARLLRPLGFYRAQPWLGFH